MAVKPIDQAEFILLQFPDLFLIQILNLKNKQNEKD